MKRPEKELGKLLEEFTIEQLDAMSDAEYANLLRPYFPAARTPVLPEGKSKKKGLTARYVEDVLEGILKARRER